jgi:hypothetical protein
MRSFAGAVTIDEEQLPTVLLFVGIQGNTREFTSSIIIRMTI